MELGKGTEGKRWKMRDAKGEGEEREEKGEVVRGRRKNEGKEEGRTRREREREMEK